MERYQDFNGVSTVGAQLTVTPVKGWTAYINVLSGCLDGAPGTGTIFDMTTAYQVTDKFKLGLNAADYSVSNDNGGYTGVALYPQYAVSKAVALGIRGEYFNFKGVGAADDAKCNSITFSANIKSGGLTFIPEVRFDNDKDLLKAFVKSDLTTLTKSASQFSLAAVYAF